jgi:small subunit ribosomal protein S17
MQGEAIEQEEARRRLRKTRIGVVTSNKMSKSVVVAVTALKMHPNYGKFIKRTIKYLAHDERNECNPGDRVRIVESRPLSRRKRWRVQTIIEKAA